MINIRNTRWVAVAAAAVIVLAGGYWAGRSQATSTATPRAESGVVSFTGTDGLTISLPGQSQPTGYALPDTVPWSDAYGNWNDGGRPGCLRHGQHITLGVVSTLATDGANGGDLVAWVKCQRRPVPHYPIVTPSATTP
jgi:hypothetical protein